MDDKKTPVTDLQPGTTVRGFYDTSDEKFKGLNWGVPWEVTKVVPDGDGRKLVYGKSHASTERPLLSLPVKHGGVYHALEGFYITSQADKAKYSIGYRCRKINSEKFDAHGDGAMCTVLGSVEEGDTIAYFVEWDDMKGYAVGIIEERLAPAY